MMMFTYICFFEWLNFLSNNSQTDSQIARRNFKGFLTYDLLENVANNGRSMIWVIKKICHIFIPYIWFTFFFAKALFVIMFFQFSQKIRIKIYLLIFLKLILKFVNWIIILNILKTNKHHANFFFWIFFFVKNLMEVEYYLMRHDTAMKFKWWNLDSLFRINCNFSQEFIAWKIILPPFREKFFASH